MDPKTATITMTTVLADLKSVSDFLLADLGGQVLSLMSTQPLLLLGTGIFILGASIGIIMRLRGN